MKKTISAAMAIALMSSLTAMSSAIVASVDPTLYYENDDNRIEEFTEPTIPYGETIYFELLSDLDAPITEYDEVKSMSVKTSWDMNGSAMGRAEIVKKKAAADDTYYYYLSLDTKDDVTTDETDVSGEITLRKSGETDVEFDVDFTLGYPIADDANEIIDEYQIHEFNEDEEDMLSFNDGYFIVDTVDQDDLLMRVTTRYDTGIADDYPTANLDFIGFNNVSFNRIGEMTIYADEGSALYSISGGGNLQPIDAEYDEYEEAFKFNTRTLGSYVISDRELEIDDYNPPEDDTDNNTNTDSTKPNPGTGAKA